MKATSHIWFKAPSTHESGSTLRNTPVIPAHTGMRTFNPWMSHSLQTPIRQIHQPGECATLTGINTDGIAAALGPGLMLPSSVRQDAEPMFSADFSRVRVHTEPQTADFSDRIGAKAFTIGQHIVFGPNAYQPYGQPGRELLNHELTHTLERNQHRDCLHGWFSRRINKDQDSQYRLIGETEPRHILVGRAPQGNTHEEITEQALAEINRGEVKYSTEGHNSARSILLWWAAEPDRWKTNSPSGDLSALSRRESMPGRPDFPELTRIIRTSRGVAQAESRLHAYRGTQPSDIGFGSEALGGGVIGTLLNEAKRNWNAGFQAHSLRLLGISLHAIQDYYAHNVPLRDNQGRDMRSPQVGGGRDNIQVLEDDPNLDRTRWNRARSHTILQLQRFYDGITTKHQLRIFGTRRSDSK